MRSRVRSTWMTSDPEFWSELGSLRLVEAYHGAEGASFELARDAFREAVRLDDASGYSWGLLGSTEEQCGDLKAAEACLRRAWEIEESGFNGLQLGLVFLLGNRDTEKPNVSCAGCTTLTLIISSVGSTTGASCWYPGAGTGIEPCRGPSKCSSAPSLSNPDHPEALYRLSDALSCEDRPDLEVARMLAQRCLLLKPDHTKVEQGAQTYR